MEMKVEIDDEIIDKLVVAFAEKHLSYMEEEIYNFKHTDKYVHVEDYTYAKKMKKVFKRVIDYCGDLK